MSDKYVYISNMDDLHGPMSESDAWAMANDQNRLTLEYNANCRHEDSVFCVAIVLDRPDYSPHMPWEFTAEHPATQKIDPKDVVPALLEYPQAGMKQ